MGLLLSLPKQYKCPGINLQKNNPEMKTSYLLSTWSTCIEYKDADITHLPCLNCLMGNPERHVIRCKTSLPKVTD